MKSKIFILPLIAVSLISCSKNQEIKKTSFYFDTYTDIRLFEGSENDAKEIDKIFSKIDKLTDNFKARDLTNIFSINSTNENVEIDPLLYEVLDLSFSDYLSDLNYFNPLCGSLSKKWKNSLEISEILSNSVILEELEKINTSSLEFVNSNTVKRLGEAELDLGAVTKGFALDKVKEFLDQKGYKKYLVDAGSSSILLGEKNKGENFTVKISNLSNAYLSLKNCFISTSSSSKQAVTIDKQVYSHIINPVTGSAINEHEAVIVISDKGYLGDILSTAFVNESIDNIKALEEKYNVKSIVIDNKKIAYKNASIEVITK